ncbi:chemotaxis protein CheW [Aquabacterium sp.]|uniref:chemotaxis protein CheW n=1 Tax=Aquabacterium sp. TaxID=1872578 RepID=UPI002CCB5B5E|nr:chemotaxis protein CheW [Aquabacterium sp.]HSW03216.1 chemotaxis protein CheW [Aquabacterium sp.]
MKTKITRRGVPFSPEVADLVSRMPAVDEYRESMLRLQGLWDSLAMLGQMSGTVPDIGGTRSEFQSLTETLLDSLARSLLANAVQQMRGQAQVAIDILVRNLFERTADVGFLSSDSDLVGFTAAADGSATGREAIESRFRDYVAKYSVYDDIVVLNPQGQVLARLDRQVQATTCHEPWLAQAAQASSYVERFGPSTLMDGRTALLFAQAIRNERGVAGVLCLSFRFDDEMHGIFSQLRDPAGRSVITLIDADRRVVASSDPWQLPLGAQLPGKPGGAEHQRLRFAGRDYLSVNTAATGYEGYLGPGWRACVLVSTELAFEGAHDSEPGQRDQAIDGLVGALDTHELFAEELHRIPRHAARIQRDLSRVLWNGRLRPAAQGAGNGGGNDFAGTLLREVGNTGEQIRLLFAQATGNLHRSALGAVFDIARARARLAVDIMDRNLYERANDCRWWALNGDLRQQLALPPDQRDAGRAAAVLQNINRLYTVYSLLLLFDAQGQVVAVSQPGAQDWVGRGLDAAWLQPTLALREGQAFQMSSHQPSALYADEPTYVYAAAVLPPAGGAALGGIAIVFDGTPQFAAMLRDVLPAAADGTPLPGCSALFVTRSGQVVASTDARWPVGSTAPLLPQALARGQAMTTVIDIDGVAHAAAFSMAGGYREYHGNAQCPGDDAAALVLMRLGQRLPQIDTAVPAFVPPPAPRSASNDAGQEIASFVAGNQWLGLPVAQVHTALEHPRIAALPGLPAHVLGMLPFEGRMIMAIDLGAVRGGPLSPVDAPVIVLHTAGGQRMALRVQELGPVFIAARADLQPVALGGPGSAGHGDKLVRSDGQMLTLLDAERLYGLCGLAA